MPNLIGRAYFGKYTIIKVTINETDELTTFLVSSHSALSTIPNPTTSFITVPYVETRSSIQESGTSASLKASSYFNSQPYSLLPLLPKPSHPDRNIANDFLNMSRSYRSFLSQKAQPIIRINFLSSSDLGKEASGTHREVSGEGLGQRGVRIARQHRDLAPIDVYGWWCQRYKVVEGCLVGPKVFL